MSNDSREGSCEQSQCAQDTECSVQLSAACFNLRGADVQQPQANYFHLSCTEHVCYQCYEEMARVGRSGADRYTAWKHMWLKESRCAPTLRTFALDTLLSYWASCRKCGRFRKVDQDLTEWTAQRLGAFECADALRHERNPCAVAESEVGALYNCGAPGAPAGVADS